MSSFIKEIKEILEQNDSRRGRFFSLFIQFLIIISIVTFSIETLPDLSDESRELLNSIELVIVLLFSVEYLLRLAVADNKREFVFSFFGLIDLIAILPFYLSFGIDLRSIRVLRLLRLFRAFKLMRYNRAIHRFHRAFVIAKEEILLFTMVTVFLLYMAAVGIYYFENDAQPEIFRSVFDSLWWAVATLTTVGYGDIFPITAGGKIFTFLILLIGLGIVAVPAGLISSAFAKARQEESDLQTNQ